MWVATKLPFIPDPYDESDQDEGSESNQYVAEGRRIVNRALQESGGGLSAGLEVGPFACSTRGPAPPASCFVDSAAPGAALHP